MERPDREAQAVAEMASTRVARPTAWLLSLALLAGVAVGPLFELLGTGGDFAKQRKNLPVLPTAAEIESALGRGDLVGFNQTLLGVIDFVDQLTQRETKLVHALLPRVSPRVVRRLHYGNGQVRVGEETWLYWERELRSIEGPGFLDPHEIQRRAHAVPTGDPMPAILDFARQLAARGIGLLVFPAPAKASVESAQLLGPSGAPGPLENPSFAEFCRKLREAGIVVVETRDLLRGFAAAGEHQYLQFDSHWRDTAVIHVAEALATEIRRHWEIPAVPDLRLTRKEKFTTGVPDLTTLLGLPAKGEGFFYETVPIEAVMGPSGGVFETRREDSRVLLLGDSYSGIYSWSFGEYGKGAGLPHQLSFALQHPVDGLVQLAEGAMDIREDLARRISRGEDRLEGKKVVVWEFVERSLAVGEWPIVELPTGPSPQLKAPPPPPPPTPDRKPHRPPRTPPA